MIIIKIWCLKWNWWKTWRLQKDYISPKCKVQQHYFNDLLLNISNTCELKNKIPRFSKINSVLAQFFSSLVLFFATPSITWFGSVNTFQKIAFTSCQLKPEGFCFLWWHVSRETGFIVLLFIQWKSFFKGFGDWFVVWLKNEFSHWLPVTYFFYVEMK